MGRLDGRVALVTGAGRRAVMTPEYRAKRIGELPVRHLGQVEVFTGQVLQPDGGWVMA